VSRVFAPAIALLLVASVALAACATGSAGTSSATGNPGGAAAHTSAPPGGPALTLAGHLSGCTPAPLTSSDITSPGLATHPSVLAVASSAATCSLRGRTAVILTFADTRDRHRANTELASVDAYYATGTTGGTPWSAAPEQISAVSGGQSIVQDAALALHGLIQRGAAH
jgi:hypothetical protein